MIIRIILISAVAGSFFPATCSADWYVSAASANSVMRFDDDGNYLGEFVAANSGGLGDPQGIAFGPDGNLYVASNGSDNVLRFDGQTGTFIDVFAADALISWPAEINFLGAHLYVSNFANANGGVYRFNATTGAGSGIFAANAPFADGQSWDSNGDLYVSSATRVIKYDGMTGALIGDFVSSGSGGLSLALDNLFLDDGTLLVSDFNTSTVKHYDTNGGFLGDAISGLAGPQGLELGPDGFLYAGSFLTGTINKYDASTFQLIETFMVAPGSSTNNFVYRANMIPEPAGMVIVALVTFVSLVRRKRC